MNDNKDDTHNPINQKKKNNRSNINNSSTLPNNKAK